MGSELNSVTDTAAYRPLNVRQVAALEAVRYDAATGLVPVVVQDVDTGHVLMLAYANREALKRTYGTGQAWFWSRSRQDYWHKGATSGHVQNVVEVRIDCDGDTVLYLVRPVGPACHTGEMTCFYRGMTRHGRSDTAAEQRGVPGATQVDVAIGGTKAVGPDAAGLNTTGLETAGQDVSLRLDDAVVAGESNDSPGPVGADVAKDVARAKDTASTDQFSDTVGAAAFPETDGMSAQVLAELWAIVEKRWRDRPNGSYTTYLFEQGVDKSAKKVGEEAVEVVLAAKNAVVDDTGNGGSAGKTELATESADLLYHLLVLWKSCGVTPEDVFGVLGQRAK